MQAINNTFLELSQLILFVTLVMLCLHLTNILKDLILRYIDTMQRKNTLSIPSSKFKDTLDLIDEFIIVYLTNYTIRELGYKEEPFIKSDEEERMVKEIAKKLVDNMSPDLLLVLSYLYDMDSIPEILSLRVQRVVMEFVINNNRTK